MALFSLRDVFLSFSGTPLLDGIGFQVESGERVCIVGRNGEGKSTLLRVISREQNPDRGEVFWSQGLKIGFLPQDAFFDAAGSVFDVVAGGRGQELDWEEQAEVRRVLSHLHLEPAALFANLSGGLKRRALLSRALVGRPDVLLLDEPTNHLDLDSIVWLEDFLLRRIKTLVFITHDRFFLRRLGTRIIEIDRGRAFDWTCDYDTFLRRRQALLDAEQEHEKRVDRKLSEEEQWIRKGIKARRTRNEGRVRELQKMREQKKARRKCTGQVSMRIAEGERSGNLVAEITNLSFAYDTRPLVTDFSTQIMRGDRIGIIGPNGAGKTTLIRLLFGQLVPVSGQVRLGTGIELVWFDQLREQLDMEKSVKDNVAGGNDWVETATGRQHVLGYLRDFLFEPQRAMLPVKVLSGGERARLLLARLFLRPSNVLVMDEPTNDLDVETLELLEEKLLEYRGTLLVVSHDRAFLNSVVVNTFVFEGGGKVGEYAGGYDDWLIQRPKPEAVSGKERQVVSLSIPAKKKGGFREQWQRKQWQAEVEELPRRIDLLESRQSQLHEQLADPALYREAGEQVKGVQTELAALENELEMLFERWEFLEARLAEPA